MRRIMLVAVIVGVLFSASANAVPVYEADGLFFGDEQTQLKFYNFETPINVVGGDPNVLEVGDILSGIFRITSSSNSAATVDRTPTGFELTGVFQTTIAETYTPVGGSETAYKMVPTAGFEKDYGTGAMIAFFEDSTIDFHSIADGTILGSTATATGGDPYFVLGAQGVWGTDYYWAANAPQPVSSPSVSTFTASLALLETHSSSLLPGDFLGLTQDPTSLADMLTGGGNLSDIENPFVLQGITRARTDAQTDAGMPWPITSFDPMRAHYAVPEPASILTFGSLFAIFGFFGLRRRNRKA